MSNREDSRANTPSESEIERLLSSFSSYAYESSRSLAKDLALRYPDHPIGWKIEALSSYYLGDANYGLDLMRKCTQAFPDNADIHTTFASMLCAAGDLNQAEISFRKAIRVDDRYAEAHHGLGYVLHAHARYQEAEQCYMEAIRLKPRYPEALNNIGITIHHLGRISEAEVFYRKAIHIEPRFLDAHLNRGNALLELGLLQDAESNYRQLIQIYPGHAEAHNNLGIILHYLGRAQEAKSSFLAAIELKPEFEKAYCNLGVTLLKLGSLVEAELKFNRALQLNPACVEAHCNLGVILKELGRLDEAENHCNLAIACNPNCAEAYSNLGYVQTALRKFTEAEKNCRRAIQLKPNLADAHNNLGVALQEAGRIAEAEKSFRQVIHLQPNNVKARSNLLFCMNFSLDQNQKTYLEQAVAFGQFISKTAVPKYTENKSLAVQRKIGLGFVSGDLCRHPVGFFLEGLIEHIDKTHFEVTAFATTPTHDYVTARLRKHFDKWIQIDGKTDAVAARYVKDSGIHILIDLSGHTANNRLGVFAYKPAPVQISWLGYFATTGLPEMDFFLADPILCPNEEESNFTETVWRLPETWFSMKLQPEQMACLSAATDFEEFTFGCFSSLSKINDLVIETWSEILKRVHRSKLVLKSKQLTDPIVCTRIKQNFADYEILGDRLMLEPAESRQKYLESYSRVDLILDTFPYPGGTTTVEALSMGVPVLTLKGNKFLSRLGESILTNAGLPEYIGKDLNDYVAKAVQFSARKNVAKAKEELRSAIVHSPLFDVKRFAKHFEHSILELLKHKECGYRS